MIVINGLKNCDTCRKALKDVAAKGGEARLRDVRAQPVSAQEVGAWHAQFGDALLNTRSTTWRGLSEEERAGDPVALMMEHPALIKRPVIEAPAGSLLLGWTPATKAALGLID
jgi:arsenate reductase